MNTERANKSQLKIKKTKKYERKKKDMIFFFLI